MSEDPIGFEGGDVNLARYIRNDPTGRGDPNGLRPDDYQEDKLKSGATGITVKKPYTIIILYGHGARKTPHRFRFLSECTAGGFVGCDPGSTNRRIPPTNRIPGLKMTDGDLVGGGVPGLTDEKQTRQYWMQQAMDGAKKKAAEYFKQGAKEVRIYKVLAGNSWIDWLVEPGQETIILTPEDVEPQGK